MVNRQLLYIIRNKNFKNLKKYARCSKRLFVSINKVNNSKVTETYPKQVTQNIVIHMNCSLVLIFSGNLVCTVILYTIITIAFFHRKNIFKNILIKYVQNKNVLITFKIPFYLTVNRWYRDPCKHRFCIVQIAMSCEISHSPLLQYKQSNTEGQQYINLFFFFISCFRYFVN